LALFLKTSEVFYIRHFIIDLTLLWSKQQIEESEMVIIQQKTGRLANRLFLFSKFIVNAIEHNYKLINPTFDEYCKYFESTRENQFGRFPISVRLDNGNSYRTFQLKTNLLRYIVPKTSEYEFIVPDITNKQNLNDPAYIDKAQKKTIYASGWFFYEGENLVKHASTIRSFFKPDEHTSKEIATCLNPIKEKHDILIGVHIRRGDYRTWKSGRYFYNNETYRYYMKSLEMQFNELGKSVAFVLCSNESISLDWFMDLNCFHAPGGMISDLYTLSECDYIFGPPSTYSMWASYYGNVPLKHLEHSRDHIHYQMFSALYN